MSEREKVGTEVANARQVILHQWIPNCVCGWTGEVCNSQDVALVASHKHHLTHPPVSTPPVPQEGPHFTEQVEQVARNFMLQPAKLWTGERIAQMLHDLVQDFTRPIPQTTPSPLTSEEPRCADTWTGRQCTKCVGHEGPHLCDGKQWDSESPDYLTPSELNALEEMRGKATPGIWECREVEGNAAIAHPLGWVLEGSFEQNLADSRYIASLHPITVGKMIEEIRAFRIKQ